MWKDDSNHYWLPANEVVTGDLLVSWDGTKLAPTKVYKVIHGISRSNYLVYADGEELPCSFSHRVIADINDFKNGTRVTMGLENVLMLKDGQPTVVPVDSVEVINDIWPVITFRLSRGRRNYIVQRYFGHNEKPINNEF